MKGTIKNAVWVALILSGLGSVYAQDAVKISGVMFGDIYYISSSNIDTLKGQYGFLARRINLNFDKKQDENVNIRVRLEMESPNIDKPREIKLIPYVKDAYILFKTLDANITVGIQPTIVFENAEKIWGYRFVEKTVLDFQKVVPSRDFGLSISRKISLVNFSLMGARGGKPTYSLYSSLSLEPMKNVLLEVSGRYERQNDSVTTVLLHPFLGYKSEGFRAGVEFTYLKNNSNSSRFLSAFATKELTRRLEAFVRFDRAFQANPDAAKIAYMVLSKDSPVNLIFTGLSYKVAKNVSIAPNISYAMYDDSSIKSDLYVKATFNVNF